MYQVCGQLVQYAVLGCRGHLRMLSTCCGPPTASHAVPKTYPILPHPPKSTHLLLMTAAAGSFTRLSLAAYSLEHHRHTPGGSIRQQACFGGFVVATGACNTTYLNPAHCCCCAATQTCRNITTGHPQPDIPADAALPYADAVSMLILAHRKEARGHITGVLLLLTGFHAAVKCISMPCRR